MSKVSCSGVSVDGSGILEMGNTWETRHYAKNSFSSDNNPMGAAIILICTDKETEAQILKDLTKNTDEKWWVMTKSWQLNSEPLTVTTSLHALLTTRVHYLKLPTMSSILEVWFSCPGLL